MRPIEHFLERSAPIPESGCWIWEQNLTSNGYPRITIDGKSVRAHRASYIAAYGSIPRGLQVLHKCDVAQCVNPAHLYAGTQQENMIDKVSRRRAETKFTPEIVRSIRNDKRSAIEIAASFGCNRETVYRIQKRITWAWLK